MYLTVDYESHEAIKVKSGKTKKEYAAPYVAGNLNYHYKEGEKAKVVTIPIVMSGDLVKPNVGHPMSIPDEAHTRHIDKYGKTTLYQTYFRLDIATSNLNLVQDEETGVREGDRFLHAGTASAGCFTAVVDKTKDDERWNTIALVLMRARTMGSDRYIGTIQFDIPKKNVSQNRGGRDCVRSTK